MKIIDLTSPLSAYNYLRSLPADQAVELPGSYERLPDSGPGDAVGVITGESANAWAAARKRWEWTAADLVEELGPQAGSRVRVIKTGDEGCILGTDDDFDYIVSMDEGREIRATKSALEILS